MNKEKDNGSDYLKDFEEWQENQYNPGYFLGGRIPGNLLNPGKPKWLGILLIMISIMTAAPFVPIVIVFFKEDASRTAFEYFLMLLQILFFGGFSLVLMIGGIRKVIK